tara:strand:+ start:266 stop:538 length:273 start_codon:yes stop_codon:yes gene_type:complete
MATEQDKRPRFAGDAAGEIAREYWEMTQMPGWIHLLDEKKGWVGITARQALKAIRKPGPVDFERGLYHALSSVKEVVEEKIKSGTKEGDE